MAVSLSNFEFRVRDIALMEAIYTETLDSKTLPADATIVLPVGGQFVWDSAVTPSVIHRWLVDSAIAVLSKGWAGMTPTERHVFRRFYDPADTGDIDERFVKTVLNNYEQIQEEYNNTFVIEFETNSEMCRNMRLFYTDLIKVHACPYLNTKENVNRGAREFVHELAHKALLVVDRPYYTPNSTRYAALKSRGHWSAQVPFIGHRS